MSTKLITPPFPASYVTLVEPRAQEGGKEKYSLQVVMSKTDPATKKFMTALKAEQDAVAKEKFGKVPKGLKRGIKDGDESEKNPEWAGCWVFTASNVRKPGIVHINGASVAIDDEQLYSGAIYRVSLDVFAWDHKTGGKGVSASLANVLWVKDGPRLDGSTAAEDDFAEFTESLAEAEESLEDVDELDFSDD